MPKKIKEGNLVRFTLRLPVKLDRKINVIAKQAELSKAAFVRNSLEIIIEQYDTNTKKS